MEPEDSEEEPKEPHPREITFPSFIEAVDSMLTKGKPLSDVKAYLATAHDYAQKIEKEQTELSADYAEIKKLYAQRVEENLEYRTKSSPDYLEPEQEAVLKAVDNAGPAPASTEMVYAAVDPSLKLPVKAVIMFLRELEDKKFIVGEEVVNTSGTWHWFPTRKGNRWLWDKRGRVS